MPHFPCNLSGGVGDRRGICGLRGSGAEPLHGGAGPQAQQRPHSAVLQQGTGVRCRLGAGGFFFDLLTPIFVGWHAAKCISCRNFPQGNSTFPYGFLRALFLG